MAEPDELYTLRAQYWLGHYAMAIDEAKQVVRRPMSPSLKKEREEMMLRAQMALGDYSSVIAQASATGGETAIQALGVAAQYHSSGSTDDKAQVLDQMKVLSGGSTDANVQLYAAQVFLDAGHLKEALQCVHLGSTLEQIALCLLIFIKMDRLDLAQKNLQQMKQKDEDAILTQLGGIYCCLATGSSAAGDALHSINALLEQYGPSPLLFNLSACANMLKGNFEEAEARLQECVQEYPDSILPDTLINMVVCSQHLQKPTDQWINQLKARHPFHPFCVGVDRVEAGFDREAGKYRV